MKEETLYCVDGLVGYNDIYESKIEMVQYWYGRYIILYANEN